MVFLCSGTPTIINGVYQWNICDTFTNSLGQRFTSQVNQWTYKQIVDNGLGPQLPQYSYLIGTTAGGYTVTTPPPVVTPVPANISFTFSGIPTVTATNTTGTINYTNSGSVGDTATATIRLLNASGQSLGSVNVTFTVQTNGQISYNVPAGLPSGSNGILVVSASVGSTVVSNAPQTSVTATPSTSYNITDFRITSQTGNSVSFAWTPPTAPLGANGYQIRTTVNGTLVVPTSPGATASSTTVNLTYAAGTYDFWIIPFTSTNAFGPDSNHISVTLTGVTTFTATQVTIQAINGVQKTFTVKLTDWTAFQLSGGVPSNQIINLVNLQNQTSVPNTINDIGNFLAANATGGTTPPPTTTPPPPAPTNFKVGGIAVDSIGMTWDASTNPNIRYLIYRNNTQQVANNYFPNAFTDTGLTASTSYTYTIKAIDISLTSNNVSTGASFTATTLAAPIPTPNFAYNVQVFASTNAPPFQLYTTQNYGTSTTGQPIPARQIAQTALNQTFNNIPNTLNALFIAKVSTADNTVQFANYLATQFPNTSPTQPPPPPRNWLKLAGGAFAGLLTLSLLTGGSSSKGKKHA